MDVTRRGFLFGSVGAAAAAFVPVKLLVPEAAPLEVRKVELLEPARDMVFSYRALVDFDAVGVGEIQTVDLAGLGLDPRVTGGIIPEDYQLTAEHDAYEVEPLGGRRQVVSPSWVATRYQLSGSLMASKEDLSKYMSMSGDPVTFVLPWQGVVTVGDFRITNINMSGDGRWGSLGGGRAQT